LTTRQFAAEQADRLLHGVTAEVTRVIKSPGTPEVHDLRVAIRRFQRVLVVLKPCFPRSESRRIRRALKRIMVQAGSVRDCDIAIRILSRLRTPESGPTAQQFRDRRDDGAKTLSASLQRWAERNLAAAWRRALQREAEAKTASVEVTAKRILPRLAAELFQLGRDAVDEDASIHQIHEFRIATKNLRYTVELFGPIYGTDLIALTQQFKQVQAVLGDVNDCATVRRMLTRQKVSGQPGGKEILAALKKRQRKKTDQFRNEFGPVFADAATLKQWKAGFKGALPLKPATSKTANGKR